jgi:opacity protein-like surface antigen
MKHLLLLMGSLAALGFAESPRTVELKGSAGYAGFEDEDNHFHAGGSVRYYVTPRFSVEPEFQYLHGTNRHSDIMVVPNLNWDFRREGTVIPYLTGGVGWLRSSFGRFRPTFRSSETFFQIGAGVKIRANQHWFVAPEFRLGTELHARVGVALGYTFGR